jgi:AcrR family transcriptional regulator
LVDGVRQKMIERTVVLLAKKGLQGTSFSQVLADSGAPRGSLYHHFPGGKDELVLAAVALAGDQAMGVLQRLSGRPATEIADAFIGLWRLVLTRSDFGAGCAVAAVTVAADTPVLKQEAGKVFRRWRALLAELLEAGGVPSGRGPALAASLISACEGGVILARGEGSLEPFELVTGEQIRQIREARGEP